MNLNTTSGSYDEWTEEQNTREEPEAVDPDVRRVISQLIEEVEKLREEKSELVERLTETEAEVEVVEEEIDELTETVTGLEVEKGELREEVESVRSQVGDLEGDLSCPACGGQVRTGQVSEVYQESVEKDGLLNRSSFEGPVKELRCPHCNEQVDVTHLPDEDRERVTDDLRRAGVAAGEPSEPAEAVDTDQEASSEVEEGDGEEEDE